MFISAIFSLDNDVREHRNIVMFLTFFNTFLNSFWNWFYYHLIRSITFIIQRSSYCIIGDFKIQRRDGNENVA